MDRIQSSTHALGIGAAGGIATPDQVYGNYLTTHGIGVLSYAECLKIFGAVYILFLMIGMGFKAVKWWRSRKNE